MTTTIDRAGTSEIFKALASEHRREILRILGQSTPEPGRTCCLGTEMCGCKLSERLGLATSTISHHMSVLRSAGLIDARKDGLWTYYSLRRDALDRAAAELREL